MKKIICLILCLCFLLVMGCSDKSDNNNTAATTKTGKLSDKIEFKIYDDQSKTWLNNSHIKEITLKNENGEKSLIITTTESGKELLKNATEASIGKVISVAADKHILYSVFVKESIKDGMILLNEKMTDYNYLFNYLTDAKDKMAGVTPPDTLVSEEDAKKTAFGHVNATADTVSDVKIKLELSEDYFGWKYCIDFSANEQKYKCEINAHTGGIVRFIFDYT